MVLLTGSVVWQRQALPLLGGGPCSQIRLGCYFYPGSNFTDTSSDRRSERQRRLKEHFASEAQKTCLLFFPKGKWGGGIYIYMCIYIHTHICTCVCMCARQLLSCVQLFATSWTVAHQAPLSLGFPRQEYQSGLPCPPPGDLPNPGIEPGSLTLQADSLSSDPPGKPTYVCV